MLHCARVARSMRHRAVWAQARALCTTQKANETENDALRLGVKLRALQRLRDRAAGDSKGTEGPSVWDVCDGVIAPATKGKVMSFAQTLPRDEVGGANVFVSCPRSRSFGGVVKMLEEYTASKGPNAHENTFFWLDAVSINQHLDPNFVTQEWVTTTLQNIITNTDHMLVLLDLYNRPNYISRMWCLWELYNALTTSRQQATSAKQNDMNGRVSVLLPQAQWKDFAHYTAKDFGGVYEYLCGVDIGKSVSHSTQDMEVMATVLMNQPNGIDGVNSVLQEFLGGWFADQAQAQIANAVKKGSAEHARLLTSLSELSASLGRESVSRSLQQEAKALTKTLPKPKSVPARKTTDPTKLIENVQVAKTIFPSDEVLARIQVVTAEKEHGADHINVANACLRLTVLLRNLEKHEELEALFSRAMSIYEKHQADRQLIACYGGLAEVYGMQENEAKCQEFAVKAFDTCERALGQNAEETKAAAANLVLSLQTQSLADVDETLLNRLLSVFDSMEADGHSFAVICRQLLGLINFDKGKFAEAETLLRGCLEEHLKSGSKNTAVCMLSLGCTLMENNNPQEAEQLFRRVLREEYMKNLDASDLATTVYNLGILLQHKRKYDESEPLLKRALDMRERLFGKEHFDVAMPKLHLGLLYMEQGRDQDAAPMLRSAIEIFDKTAPGSLEAAHASENLAIHLVSQGEHKEAEHFLSRAIKAFETQPEEYFDKLTSAQTMLGSVLREQGKFDESEQSLRRMLTSLEKTDDKGSIAMGNFELAKTLSLDMGKVEEAEQLYKKCLDIYEEIHGKDSESAAAVCSQFAHFLFSLGRFAEALPYLEQALRTCEVQYGPNHPETANLLQQIALALSQQQKFDEGEASLRRALAIREGALGSNHPETATNCLLLAAILQAQAKLPEALDAVEQALGRCQIACGADHPTTSAARSLLDTIKSQMSEQ